MPVLKTFFFTSRNHHRRAALVLALRWKSAQQRAAKVSLLRDFWGLLCCVSEPRTCVDKVGIGERMLPLWDLGHLYKRAQTRSPGAATNTEEGRRTKRGRGRMKRKQSKGFVLLLFSCFHSNKNNKTTKQHTTKQQNNKTTQQHTAKKKRRGEGEEGW